MTDIALQQSSVARVAGLAQRPSRGARKVGTATGCTRQVPSPAGIAHWRLLAFSQIASCENWVTLGCDALPIGIVGTRAAVHGVRSSRAIDHLKPVRTRGGVEGGGSFTGYFTPKSNHRSNRDADLRRMSYFSMRENRTGKIGPGKSRDVLRSKKSLQIPTHSGQVCCRAKPAHDVEQNSLFGQEPL